MTRALEDLTAAITAGDQPWVIEVCRRHGLTTLRSMRPEIVQLIEEARTTSREVPFETWRARSSAASIAGCLAATTVVQAVSALDYPASEPDPDLLIDALVDLSPKWLPRLGQRLLGSEFFREVGWQLCYELVKRGVCERPADPRYVDQMIYHCEPVYERLVGDAMLREEIWGLFETDRRGLQLSNGLHGERWSKALAQLVDDGLVERDRLIDAALGALTMQSPWIRLRWYALLVNALDPSYASAKGHAAAYLALLRSSVPQVVAVAQHALGPLLKSGSLRPEPFLDVASSPFSLKDKKIALAQLQMLEAVAKDDQWVPDVVDAASLGMGHPNREVQTKALRFVQARLDLLTADRKALVEQQYELLPASMRPAGPTAEHPQANDGLGSRPPTRAPVSDGPPEPFTDDKFVEALAAIMEGQSPAPILDRAIAAAFRICGYPQAQQAELVRPLLPRTNPQFVRDIFHAWAIRCVETMSGLGEDPRDLESSLEERLVDDLLDEAILTVASGRPRAYLALPTDESGAINPHVLRERLANLTEEVGPAERLAATLRADIDRQLIALTDIGMAALERRGLPVTLVPTVTVTWNGPALHCEPESPFEHRVDSTATAINPMTGEEETCSISEVWTDPRKPILNGDEKAIHVAHYLMIQYAFDPNGLAWWLKLLPSYPDLGGVMVMRSFGEIMDTEPSFMRPNCLAPLLDRYCDEPHSIGDLDAVLIAVGLAAKPASCRIRAVDALIAVAGLDRQTVALIGGWAAHLVSAKFLKLSRLGDVLEELVRREPLQARDFAMPLLEQLANHRDIHRILDLTADAFAVCGSVSLPSSVHELAGNPGSSKALVAARRLVQRAC